MRILAIMLLATAIGGAQPSLEERYRFERLERSVEATYADLGRRHTPLRLDLLRVPQAAMATYLNTLLQTLDLAVALRVEAVTNLQAGRLPLTYRRLSPRLRSRLEALTPPAVWSEPHRLILAALDDQSAFFNDWARHPGSPLDLEETAVRRAHWRLRQAYDFLLQNLPPQEVLVLEAIYDPFHALDFLGVTP